MWCDVLWAQYVVGEDYGVLVLDVPVESTCAAPYHDVIPTPTGFTCITTNVAHRNASLVWMIHQVVHKK